MRRVLPVTCSCLLLVACGTTPAGNTNPDPDQNPHPAPNFTMRLSSSAFENDGTIPATYTCDGESVSPPLAIGDVPAGAKSFVLLMEDPDALSFTWDHWIIFNMPPSITEIPQGTQPEGIAGNNTRGQPTYIGPCPPDREHRYIFTVFALDTMLGLPEGVAKPAVQKAMQGHVIAQAELIGRYNRQPSS